MQAIHRLAESIPSLGKILPCSQIFVPWLGDKVNSGIGVRVPYDNLYAEVDFIPQAEIYEFGYRVNSSLTKLQRWG